MDLSVIIVNWNARCDLLRCLESLAPLRDRPDREVLVVDNGSRDGSAQAVRRRFPWVRLLATGRNLGFAAGNNRGLAVARGRYLLLLNPDTVVHGDALGQLVAAADAHPEAALLGPRLLNTDGSLQLSCRGFPTVAALLLRNTVLGALWPNNPWVHRYVMDDWPHDRPRTVDWLSGACLLARREFVESVGGLDERYFMYVEDMDWGRQAHTLGQAVIYLPSACVTHHIGRSSDQRPLAMVLAHHASMWHYVRKHYGLTAGALAAPLIALRLGAVLLKARWSTLGT